MGINSYIYKLEKQEKQTKWTNNLCQTFVSFSFWCAVLQIDDSSSYITGILLL